MSPQGHIQVNHIRSAKTPRFISPARAKTAMLEVINDIMQVYLMFFFCHLTFSFLLHKLPFSLHIFSSIKNMSDLLLFFRKDPLIRSTHASGYPNCGARVRFKCKPLNCAYNAHVRSVLEYGSVSCCMGRKTHFVRVELILLILIFFALLTCPLSARVLYRYHDIDIDFCPPL